jgi:hypothetical protein
MTLTVDNIESRRGYLHATVSGEFSLRFAQSIYDRVVQQAVQLGLPRVLIDARNVTGKPSQEERYAFGLFVATEQRLLTARSPELALQVAVLGRQPLIDPQRFGETVAVNRGAKFKESEHLDEVLSWLGVNPTAG